MRPQRLGTECPTSEKVDLAVRLLAGETLGRLAEETGRPKKQLSAWRRRFLDGGEAHLNGYRERPEDDALRAAQEEFAEQLAILEGQNRMLARQAAILGDRLSGDASHPYCSKSYAYALEERGIDLLYVESWDTYVLVRKGQTGIRQATGLQPFGSLDPRGDVRAGLEELREAGIATISVITDPMWSPHISSLRQAFDISRPFKEYFVIDRETDGDVRKRHRNRINQARRAGEVRDIALADHLDRWMTLYQGNVESRNIAQPLSSAYFEKLAMLDGLRTVAVVVGGDIATMSLWISHRDTVYFHDGASSVAGKEMSAAYAAFSHLIETSGDYRYILLGGAAGLRDDRTDGVAIFKRGFANTSVVSNLCSSALGD